MTKNGILMIAGLVIVAILIIFASFRGGTPTPPAETPATMGEPTPSSPPTTQKPAQTKPAPAPAPVTPKTSSGITVTTPLAGEKLVIGQTYKIRWSKESGATGFIYLADATTKETVGWINSQTGVHDISYTWDVRDVFLVRYSPSKKPVTVGKYIIGIGFDNKQAPIISGMFEIIYPSQLAIENYNLTIQNYDISPSQLTVKKGSKLIFANEDSVVHKIVSGSANFLLPAGESHILDTDILFPGTYDFYSEQYPTTARATVNVQ